MTSALDARQRGPAPRIRRIRGDGRPETAPPTRRRTSPAQLVQAAPRLEESFATRAGVDIDGLFAFALFAPMLFIGKLGTPGGAMIAGLVPLYLLMRRQGLFRLFLPRSFLFLIPGYALFSAVWSSAPGETLRYGTELGVTACAGLLLSSARNQEAVVRGIATAFLSYVVAAILSGGHVYVGVGLGGEALTGLSESKNLLADIAATGLVVSAAMTLMAIRGRDWLWVAFGAFSIGLDLYCAVAARSAGALVGLGMAIMAIAGLTPLVYAGRVLRAWVTGMIGVSLVGVGVGYSSIAQAVMNLSATLFDKDPTLTGRTYLWYRAADLIREHPLLGRGFYAFWLQGNIDAEGLWRFFGIDGRGGFTFHNTFIEILVMLGGIGLALIAGVVFTGMAFLIRRFVTRPSLPLVFWIAILLYELARTPIETVGINPFYFSTALMFAALGAAFDRDSPLCRQREVTERAWTIATRSPPRAVRPATDPTRLRRATPPPAEGR